MLSQAMHANASKTRVNQAFIFVNFLNSKNEQREMSPFDAVPSREMTVMKSWLMKADFRDVL